MAEAWFHKEQEKYDYLQFSVPDVNSIPRGKMVKGKFKEKFAKSGIDIDYGCCITGPNLETDPSISNILGENFPNVEMRPCLDTLTPWPWVGNEDCRIGNVLCDLFMADGTPDPTSPRQILKAQLEALKEQHGLLLKSAFEVKFAVYKTGTMEPLGGNSMHCLDMRHSGRHHDLFGELSDLLEVMGVEVYAWLPEISPGQWEMNMEPQEGVRGADVVFYMKNAVKSFFEKRGYTATFMTMPTLENFVTNLHLNHSLWTKEGEEERNVMLDKSDPDLLSPTARHWLAGILTHSPALTALCSPTLNCFKAVHQIQTPSKITWGIDNRNALVRVRNARDNVFFENRLSTGPCSPYLAIAATVAAGLDGLNRKLPCPKAMDIDQAAELPKSLSEALDALEKDELIRSMLGSVFVDCFITNKRGYEVKTFDTTVLNTEEKQMDFVKKMYMKNL